VPEPDSCAAKNRGEAFVFHQQETSFFEHADLISGSSWCDRFAPPHGEHRVPTPQTESQGCRPVGQVNAVSAALGGLIATAAALGIGRFVYTPILPPMDSITL
jgi:hypothetical protein